MIDKPRIAPVAALLGDPARANIVMSLMDGRALTASELAAAAGVTLQTASSHLAKLLDGGLLKVEKQGRHKYFRLSGTDAAQLVEALMGFAQRSGADRIRTGPRDAALRAARVCYDHLAGPRAVELFESLERKRFIEGGGGNLRLTQRGRSHIAGFGIDLAALERGRRPLCRSCLDWSERRTHLGGALGAALLTQMLTRKWMRRGEGRLVTFLPRGEAAFRATFLYD